MQNKYILGIILVILLFLALVGISKLKPVPKATPTMNNLSTNTQTAMQIQSPAFAEDQSIPMKYTCEGDNINPELNFSEVPKNSQSLALIIEDPDVPTTLIASGMFDHWLTWNMPPTTSKIGESEKSPGVTGNNSAGKPGYTGPCPPDREHRYFFKLYALDTLLDLPQNASKTQLQQAMAGHILQQAELMGRYDKKNK